MSLSMFYIIVLGVALLTALMTVPTQTARQTPSGIKLTDGFSSTISFALVPTISIWEIQVKAPGIDGGEPIVTSTMHNTAWHTMAPRRLKKLTPISTTCAYDPVVYTDILSLINIPGSITVWFPDDSAVSFYGYLQKFEPGELKEGEFPTAQVIIVPTNYDPVNKVEAAPLVAATAGT